MDFLLGNLVRIHSDVWNKRERDENEGRHDDEGVERARAGEKDQFTAVEEEDR